MNPDRDSAHTLAHYEGLLRQAQRERDLDRFGLKEVMRVTNLNDKHPPEDRVAELEQRVIRLEQGLAQLRADLDQEIHRRKQRVLNLEHDRGGRGA